MLGIVAQHLGLAPGHPGTQRALFLLMAPCLALLVAPRGLRHDLLPALAGDAERLVEDILDYAEAGLAGIARQYAGQGS